MTDLPTSDEARDRLIGHVTAAHRPLCVRSESGQAIQPKDAANALRLVGPVRGQMDGLERRLIDTARELGLTWKQIAQALGLDSPQAAQQRFRRLNSAINTDPSQ